MKAIFALLVLVGCSYAMPQELGASPVAAVETSDITAADTPAAATNVEAEPAAEASVAEGDVNRQGLVSNVNAQAEGAGIDGGAAASGPAGPQCSIHGCAFYGPGLNNPAAVVPNPAQIAEAQTIAVQNPNLRVFVGVDGLLLLTDVFGREQEVVDQFGVAFGEVVDPVEQQELAQENVLIDLDRRTMVFRAAELAKLGLDPTGAPLPVAAGAAPFKFPQVTRVFSVATQAA